MEHITMSDFLIFKAAFNNSATPAIGTYTAEGATASFTQDASLSPDYYLYNTADDTAVQWFVPTKETTDFEFVADILTDDQALGGDRYFIIADSTGAAGLCMLSSSSITEWRFMNGDSTATSDPEYVGAIDPATSGGFDKFHQFRVRVCKLTASSSSVEVYVDGTLKLTATAGAALVTCAKIGFIGGVTGSPSTSAGIKNAYVYDLSGREVIDRGVLSGAFNQFISWMKSKLTLESLSTNSIAFHNSYPRCKYLGTSITDAQNTAIKNRTYDDLFIGDYWAINGVNWRIVAIDYYYNVGDTNFDKGNIIVMPDTALYNAQMNETNTTAGAYTGSLMRTQNLNNARTIAQNAFGSRLANHRIMLANDVDDSGPSGWNWYDSDGVELPNEIQIYGTRIWGSALKGFDVGTQKQQFPLLALAPQFVNIRQDYRLQDVSSRSVSNNFAFVNGHGFADSFLASSSYGVRPAVTLSYI
jgi:hypothetical protein